MTVRLQAVCVDAHRPEQLARFWAGVLGRETGADGVTLHPNDSARYDLVFRPTDAPRVGQGRMHLDLTSASARVMQETVDRALALGAQHIDVGQTPDEGHVVLADPEGNPFCVIPPGNEFLADTAFIGAINCDGSQEVGYFWSEALGWPLVWDQDEETAIQSPDGGSKMSWGGPPVEPKHGKNRWHLHVAPGPEGNQRAEVQRLVELGARHADVGQEDADWVVLMDPDGNEFCVLPPR